MLNEKQCILSKQSTDLWDEYADKFNALSDKLIHQGISPEEVKEVIEAYVKFDRSLKV